MARLDTERQNRLEPERFKYAKTQLENMGFKIINENRNSLQFEYKNEVVTLFPYSGWHTGRSIQDGRGLNNLLKQLSND